MVGMGRGMGMGVGMGVVVVLGVAGLGGAAGANRIRQLPPLTGCADTRTRMQPKFKLACLEEV